MRGQGGRRGTQRVLCTLLSCAVVHVAAAPAAQAQISVGDATASEATGSMTFTITRQAPLLGTAVTVSFATSEGSASSPADFAAASGSRTFPSTLFAQTQTRQVTVTLVDDARDEFDEGFRLVVSGNGVGDGVGLGTILDDDPSPSLAAGNAPAAAEGATAVFTVALGAPSGRSVSVNYATANGTAVAGQDYAARSGTVTIPAGATSAQIGVPLTDDGADEPNESFELRLSAPVNARLADATGTATIVDDDEPPAAAPPPPPPPAGLPPGVGPLAPPTTGSSTGSGALPQLGVSRPRLRLPGTILVTLSCPRDAGRCRGRLTIFSRPNKRSKIKALRVERRLARREFGLVAGASRTLEMPLSRRDRVLLKRAGRINVRVYIVTTDGAGRTGVRRVNGVLIGRTTHG